MLKFYLKRFNPYDSSHELIWISGAEYENLLYMSSSGLNEKFPFGVEIGEENVNGIRDISRVQTPVSKHLNKSREADINIISALCETDVEEQVRKNIPKLGSLYLIPSCIPYSDAESITKFVEHLEELSPTKSLNSFHVETTPINTVIRFHMQTKTLGAASVISAKYIEGELVSVEYDLSMGLYPNMETNNDKK